MGFATVEYQHSDGRTYDRFQGALIFGADTIQIDHRSGTCSGLLYSGGVTESDFSYMRYLLMKKTCPQHSLQV